jgi:Flp pilus assembly protein TadD
MFLFNEPAWRFLLCMGFISVYSLYRIIAPICLNYHRKWRRIKKISDRVLLRRIREGTPLHTPVKVEIPVMSSESRWRLGVEVTSGALVLVISVGWGVSLLQTAVHTHRGLVSADEHDEYRAAKEYELAIQANPVAGKLHYAMNAMQTDGDRQNGDLSAVQVYVRLHPEDSHAYNRLGSAYMGLQRYKEAIKAYREGLKFRQDSGLLHSNLGNALSADLQIDAAIAEYQKAVDTDPVFGAYHTYLGNLYLYKHDMVHAETEYRTAIRDTPALVQPYWRLSEILASEGHREAAREILNDLLKRSHMPEDDALIKQLRASVTALK